MNLALRSHSGIWFSIVLCALMVLAFVKLELPGNSLLIGAVQNAGHTLAFLALTLCTLLTIGRHVSGVFTVFLICTVLTGIGVFIEVAQHFAGRGFSPADIVKNTLGVVTGLCLFMAMNKRAIPQRMVRYLLLLAAAIMITISFAKAIALLISSLLTPSLPQLISFDQWGADLWIKATGGQISIAHHNDVWESNDTESVRVIFDSKRWRVLQLLEPHPDWTGFDKLSFTVFNPSATAVKAMFRIDELDGAMNLREGTTLLKEFSYGESVISIDLQQLRHTVSTRFNYVKPPLTEVRSITFFTKGEQQATELYFDNFIFTTEAPLK